LQCLQETSHDETIFNSFVMHEEEIVEQTKRPTRHMGWRGSRKNYCWPGIYHITINVKERRQQPLGRVVGDVSKPDGDPQAPKVALTEVGRMVEQELTESIHAYYPMIEVSDFVIMPDHLHFILVVHSRIVSPNGRETHLGQVIAGFKKGCNRRYWEITGLTAAEGQGEPAPAGAMAPAGRKEGQGEPAPAGVRAPAGRKEGQGEPASAGARMAPAGAMTMPEGRRTDVETDSLSVVPPQEGKAPSTGNTGRPPLFEYGYVDVMPLKEGQLEQQRQYIHDNPRYRLLRMNHREYLTPQRGGIDTALKLPALKGYLERECSPSVFSDDVWKELTGRLLVTGGLVACDSYGSRNLLGKHLLPVVCHHKDAYLRAQQKEKCLTVAAEGAVLVSARISRDEKDIMDAVMDEGYPVITIEDNGFPEIYHPSAHRTELCATGKLLIVTPWQYKYRRVDEGVNMPECKTMNCLAQALCRMKDSWWKE